MRRGVVIAAVIVTILAGIGIGVGAYRTGEDAGITQGIEQEQTAQGDRPGGAGRARRRRRARARPSPASSCSRCS